MGGAFQPLGSHTRAHKVKIKVSMADKTTPQVKRIREEAGQKYIAETDSIIIEEFNRVNGIRANMDWTKVITKVHEDFNIFLTKTTLMARLHHLRPSKQALRKEPGSATPKVRGKKLHWTTEEDLRLSDAVRKSTGEYTNWNQVCAEFGGSRSKSSLINRWNIIKSTIPPPPP